MKDGGQREVRPGKTEGRSPTSFPCGALPSAVTFYDASFLALSRLLGCPLVTADKKLYRKARSFAKLTLLGDL
jgi:hypothetical protein